MKTLRYLAAVAAAVFTCGCSEFDDSEIWTELKDHEQRLSGLETLCRQINTNITSLRAIVEALQSNDYVISVAPVNEGKDEVGYVITFTSGKIITIYHGKNGTEGEDGIDGTTPVIGAKQDSDGLYYWTLNGDWLLDESGNKIPTTGKDGQQGAEGKPGAEGATGVSGQDGNTPQLKIEEGYWYVSYDDGITWINVGKAKGEDGDSIFKNVTYDADVVCLLLSDGSEILLPRQNTFELFLENTEIMCNRNETVSVAYKITGSAEDVSITVISEGGYMTSVESLDCYAGNITIKASENFLPGKVIVMASAKSSVKIKEIRVNIPVNLSVSGTANSYIVSKSGVYYFDAVKGNGNEGLDSAVSAEVLWESFGTDVTPDVGDLITSVKYLDGKIYFTTQSAFTEGNSVIAAKNASGTVLWSWHIWLTDEPKGQIYYNDAGTMMDRNLGATSAVPGSAGSLGLLYEWGRKDPFLGFANVSSNVEAHSTLTWPSPLESSAITGTIEYTVANPTTYIYHNSFNRDWCFSGDASWDETRWQSVKTIYDPCPLGWRVPDGGFLTNIWAIALGLKNHDIKIDDGVNGGTNFSGLFGDDEIIWYPITGHRDFFTGNIMFLNSGNYWSAENDSMYLMESYVAPCNQGGGGIGYAVRCQKEDF